MSSERALASPFILHITKSFNVSLDIQILHVSPISFFIIEAKTKGQAASGGSRTFDSMKEQMGSLVKTPMTREEACLILNIEENKESTEPVDYKEVMEVSDNQETFKNIITNQIYSCSASMYFSKRTLLRRVVHSIYAQKYSLPRST